MNVLTALARVDAAATGRAQAVTLYRHVYVSPRPLVLVPLALSGEAAAPLAVMFGTDRDEPRLLIVPQPRDRELRRQFFAEFAKEIDAYAEEEPQVVVPNRACANFLRLLGRSTRFQEGDRVGRWLTYFTDRSDYPGSSALLTATGALTLHWATGQSALEDADLASLLGWVTGERSSHVPAQPAAPWTTPEFDNHTLGPLIDAYEREEPGVSDALARALSTQLDVIWGHTWQALDLLRQLPEARSVPERWLWDVAAYTALVGQLDGPPQPIRDDPLAAAARLDHWERGAARYAAQRAFDDPLVMAAHRLTGEAFRCVVTATEPDRKEGRKLRPRVTVVATEPVLCDTGDTLTSPTRRGQPAVVTAIDDRTVVLTLTGGMGRGMIPAAGSVPEVGEDLVYASLSEAFQRSGPLPEHVPWTHGGNGGGNDDD
ncbi:MAG: hypothetical protein H0T78_08015 [Longispora sp.]|nr:hypothetical protein [Longispora sp. (in: high G+C Gram-positive bacteria)]